MTRKIEICEVAPRDGLQNEKVLLSCEEKIAFIERLEAVGLSQMEIGSFVHPKAVPAMADTDAVMKGLAGRRQQAKSRHLGIIMNERGLERAIKAGVAGVCIVTVVSESLSQKNNRRSALDACKTALELLKGAKAHGLYTRVMVAPSFVCPFEGEVALDAVLRHADAAYEFSPDELVFCDTIGAAHPRAVTELFTAVKERYGLESITAHFHDTRALGLANAAAAMQVGIRRFDASLGGLGGCPFAPGAKGNLATEDLVHLCHEMGLETSVSLSGLWETVAFMESLIKRPLGGQSKSFWLSKQGKNHGK